MDQNQKQKSLIQFLKSQFLKRAFTKLIIFSVSVFSLLFSHSTLLSFLHYFNFYYFSTLPFKLFSHTLDKNCTFLLCNGLLVFLANYSGLFSLSSSSSNKYNLNDLKNYEDESQPKMTSVETKYHHQLPIPMLEHEAEFENTQNQENKKDAMQHEKEHEKSEAAKAEAEDSTEEILEEEEEEEERAVHEEDKDKAESRFFVEEVDDEEEEEEEEGNGKLSDEELNKKFDDFIRKMKEELRIEARQQLIMV